MNKQSFLDRSVFCVCSRSIFSKLFLDWIFFGITVTMSFVGCVLNSVYYCDPSRTTIYSIGLGFHITSVILTWLLTSYLGRYLSKMQHSDNQGGCFAYHSLLGYIVPSINWFFIFVNFIGIGWTWSSRKSSLLVINALSNGIVMYFISSMILWYSIVVFKPLIPNFCYSLGITSDRCYLPMDEVRDQKVAKHGRFVYTVLKYCFYEIPEDCNKIGIWSSISLLVSFCISVIVMNVGFAVYYNDVSLHNWIIALGIIFTFVPMILQGFIFIASYKDSGNFDRDMIDSTWCMIFCWIGFVAAWFLAGIIVMFLYMPYNGWSIDASYPTTSQARNVFFIVQGVPGLLVIAGSIVVGLCFLIKCISPQSCVQWFKNELDDAKNQVNGFTQIDESTPL